MLSNGKKSDEAKSQYDPWLCKLLAKLNGSEAKKYGGDLAQPPHNERQSWHSSEKDKDENGKNKSDNQAKNKEIGKLPLLRKVILSKGNQRSLGLIQAKWWWK